MARRTPHARELARAADRRRLEAVVQRNSATRLRNKLRLMEEHGGVCLDCKLAWPPFVMEFDHRDPTEKRFIVSGSRLQWSYDRLAAEAAKCDLVCSNCHRLRTHRMTCEGCSHCE